MMYTTQIIVLGLVRPQIDQEKQDLVGTARSVHNIKKKKTMTTTYIQQTITTQIN